MPYMEWQAKQLQMNDLNFWELYLFSITFCLRICSWAGFHGLVCVDAAPVCFFFIWLVHLQFGHRWGFFFVAFFEAVSSCFNTRVSKCRMPDAIL